MDKDSYVQLVIAMLQCFNLGQRLTCLWVSSSLCRMPMSCQPETESIRIGAEYPHVRSCQIMSDNVTSCQIMSDHVSAFAGAIANIAIHLD